jgi:hypothetical protein
MMQAVAVCAETGPFAASCDPCCSSALNLSSAMTIAVVYQGRHCITPHKKDLQQQKLNRNHYSPRASCN